MTASKVLAAIVRSQLATLRRVVSRVPLAPPPLAFGALEPADLAIARAWLEEPERGEADATVRSFEDSLARMLEVPRVHAFASGREALSACLESLDLEPGAEVLLPGFTCVVVDNAVRFAGLQPIYCDIELETYGLDIEEARRRASPRTRVLLLHHLFGLVCRDYEALVEFARQRGLIVIEDCAQALGTRFRGRSVGTLGDLAFWSFERSKTLTTIEGGAAAAAQSDFAQSLERAHSATPEPEPARYRPLLETLPFAYDLFAHPARWWRGDLARIRLRTTHLPWIDSEQLSGLRPATYGRKMAAPLAALGNAQLARAETTFAARRTFVCDLIPKVSKRGWRSPTVIAGSDPIFLRYPVLVSAEEKYDLWRIEKAIGFRPGVWFTSQLHPSNRPAPGCPRAEEAVWRCVNFPTLPNAARL
jgi:dTDP-4-amino-4,6-dideoxygalactose transaminase